MAAAVTCSSESGRLLHRPASPDVVGRLNYVLITPARNEAAFIEQTIRSVIGQTVLPLKWVIVSDGSTDSTNDILKKIQRPIQLD